MNSIIKYGNIIVLMVGMAATSFAIPSKCPNSKKVRIALMLSNKKEKTTDSKTTNAQYCLSVYQSIDSNQPVEACEIFNYIHYNNYFGCSLCTGYSSIPYSPPRHLSI
jgi:hypothetical protein